MPHARTAVPDRPDDGDVTRPREGQDSTPC